MADKAGRSLPQGWRARKRGGLGKQFAPPPLLPQGHRRICCGFPTPSERTGHVRTPRQGAMIDKPDTDRGGNAARERRLRAALRKNLKRRKSQSRGRADQTVAAERSDSERDDE